MCEWGVFLSALFFFFFVWDLYMTYLRIYKPARFQLLFLAFIHLFLSLFFKLPFCLYSFWNEWSSLK